MIVMDTHALIWLANGSGDLGRTARTKLDAALREGGLAVSAISFWECGMLVDKGRITLSIDPMQWRTDLLASGLEELPVTGRTGIAAARLPNFHGDPADRLIVATALENDAHLATADHAILDWSGSLQRMDARN